MCCLYNNAFRSGFNMCGGNGGYIYVYGRLCYSVAPRYYNRCRCMQNNFNYPVPYMMSDYFRTGNGYGYRTFDMDYRADEPTC